MKENHAEQQAAVGLVLFAMMGLEVLQLVQVHVLLMEVLTIGCAVN